MKTKTTTLRLLALTTSLTFHTVLHAATVTSGGVSTIAANGVAPGTAANYDFFGGAAQPANLTTFTLSTPPAAMFDPISYGHGVTYSSVQPSGGGTVFETGIGLSSTGYATTPYTADLATFTVKAGTGSNLSFSAYVLFGNTNGGAVFDAKIQLSIDGGAAFAIPVTDTTVTNDFVVFNLSGVNAGDTLTFGATDSAADANGRSLNEPYIGGVTFSQVVPEPSTWAAVAVGAGLLGVMTRRRERGA